jgi:hypothetical protein
VIGTCIKPIIIIVIVCGIIKDPLYDIIICVCFVIRELSFNKVKCTSEVRQEDAISQQNEVIQWDGKTY